MKRFPLFFILSIAILFADHVIAQTYSKEVEERIKQVEENLPVYYFQPEGGAAASLVERMKDYKVKGLSIAVISNYKIEWVKGYGWADSAAQRPVTANTIFQAGSVSKSLNATGVLKLVQDQKIDLSSDINTYLTSWKFPYDQRSKNKTITVNNLLCHTAGLTVPGFMGYRQGEALPSVTAMLDGKAPANNLPVRSQTAPGKSYMYSGGGTMISQLIVMDVSKMPYDEYMKENVFIPLGMANSFYTQPSSSDQDRIATGYRYGGEEVKGKYYVYPEQAAAGLWSTPSDLASYIIETQLAYEGRSSKVLSPKMTKLRFESCKGNSAMGFFIEKKGSEKYFQHNGSTPGFRCQLYGSMKDGNGAVVMINSDNSGIIQEVINSIAAVYKWKDFYTAPVPEVKKVIAIPDSMLDKYTGIYRQGDEITVITKKDNALWYSGSSIPWRMYFTSGSTFFNRESKAEKSFYFDEKGNVKGFAKSIGDKQLGKVEKVQPVALQDTLLEKYAGTYNFWDIPSRIIQKDHHLYLEMTDTLWELRFLSPGEFFLPVDLAEYGETFSFTVDVNGKVNGIIEKRGANKTLLPKMN